MYSCALSKPLTIIYYDHGIANISYKVSEFFSFSSFSLVVCSFDTTKIMKEKKTEQQTTRDHIRVHKRECNEKNFFGLNRIRRDWMKRDRATHHDDKWFYVR